MKKLYNSLISFQNECPAIALNSKVSFTTKSGVKKEFGYANLSKIHEVVKPILQKNQLGFIQLFDNYNLITTVFHAEGESISSSINLQELLTKSDPQTCGAIITYFKRYSLAAILGIISEEDDEKNLLHTNQNEIKNNLQQPQQQQQHQLQTIWLTDENFKNLQEMFESDEITTLEKACKIFNKYCNKPYAMKKEYKNTLQSYYNETVNILYKSKNA